MVAVLSAAALLAIGASMTSMAANGWTQQDGQWYYYNNSGEYVTDTWKKSGNSYFYLGDDGAMLTNALIEDGDDYYYVDGNGAMVKSQWIQIADDDDENLGVDYRWYYFGPTGRAYTSDSSDVQKKTINGKKYAFDEDGKMLFGFVDDGGTIADADDDDAVLNATYYFGTNEDGAMHTGWLNYTEGVDDDTYDEEKFGDGNSLWFYYNTNTGKKEVNKPDKKINGYKYAFDSNGVMQPEWYAEGASGSVATEQKYFSTTDEGWQKKNTWVWAIPSQEMSDYTQDGDSDDYDEDTYRWFYVDNEGKRKIDGTKKIKGKWYAFDDIGRTKDGFIVLDRNRVNNAKYVGQFDADDITKDELLGIEKADDDIEALIDNIGEKDGGKFLYYFSDDAETDGAMKTGDSVKIDLADDTYTFGFEDDGEAKEGIDKNDKLYVKGILMDAGSDKYNAVTYHNNVFVTNVSGKIQKKGTSVKNDDGDYYAIVTADKNVNSADSKSKTEVYWVDGSDDDASKIASAIAGRKGKGTRLDNRGVGLEIETDKDGNEKDKVDYNFSNTETLKKFADAGIIQKLVPAGTDGADAELRGADAIGDEK